VNPYSECPRFQKCSVNHCPSHPSYPNLLIDPEDKEQKCTMEKQVRFKIGSKYPDILKWQGLTSREWTGKKKFEALSDSEKEATRQRANSMRVGSKTPLSSGCQSKNTDLMVNVGAVEK